MHLLSVSLMTPNPMISCGTNESISEIKNNWKIQNNFSWHVFAVGERILPLIFPSSTAAHNEKLFLKLQTRHHDG